MSSAMMSAPSSASRSAWLRPWPRAAPVINATLPATRPVMRFSPIGWNESSWYLGFFESQRDAVGAVGDPRRPRELGRISVEFQIGNPGQELFERDGDLHAGQVHAHAAVDAQTEAGVAAAWWVELQLVGVGKLLFVAVSRVETHQHPVALAHRAPADLGVARNRATECGYRGCVPDELVHVVAHPARISHAGFEFGLQ